MGNYYCKKCYIPLNYYDNIEHSRQLNCSEHNYDKDGECIDCNCKEYFGGCKHKFKFGFNCFD